jgi:hypothetical protein
MAGLFVVALAGWTLYLIQMDATVFNDPEEVMQKWTTWVGVPLAGLLLVLLSQWGLTAFATSRGEAKAEARNSAAQHNAASLAGQDPRHYVLEVIGLGVSLDKHRQGRLWDALQKGAPSRRSARWIPEVSLYGRRQARHEGGADASALENGIGGLPMYWPAPPSTPPNPPQTPSDPLRHGSRSGSWPAPTATAWGRPLHPGRLPLSDHPDRLLEEAFAFFDAHPDVPYLVVAANDGLYFRPLPPERHPPLVRDGHYVPEMPGSSALFVLARRERVDALRPFAFDDTDQDAGPRAEPHRPRPAPLSHPLRLSEQLGQAMGNGRLDRWPTVPEWLAAAALRPTPRRRRPRVRLAPPPVRRRGAPPRATNPPLVPDPLEQVPARTFDRLPTLGYLHRPTYIQLTDADGKPSPAAASASRPSSKAGTRPSSPSPKPSARPPSSASSAAPATTPTSSSSSPP